MKNKTLLPLMEQLIMILVFALAAALCLQGFAAADRISKRQEILSEAVVITQNTADVLKSSFGDYEFAADILGGTVTDNGLQIDKEDYILVATSVDDSNDFLSSSHIQIIYEDETIFEVTASWQEGSK